MKLSMLKRGEKGMVIELDTGNDSILRKLMSMGIMPGAEVEVIQAYPCYVIQAGYTQVSIDNEIASAIIIDV